MRIKEDIKLDFSDVLIEPKRSTLKSRKDVNLIREFKPSKHSNSIISGVPIIAANMDTVGTFEMARVLAESKCFTALHKHYSNDELNSFFNESYEHVKYCFYSMGIGDTEYAKLKDYMNRFLCPKMICIDVANGYSTTFEDFVRKIRDICPASFIMAGNVVTPEMTEQLILSGADCIKVGIGGGSVCTTRKMAGIGFPQLSAIIECADAAHGLGGMVCSDGGCTTPGDVSKAFGGGADFVMLGGMLAGHTECGGTIITENDKQYMEFYGMSSAKAMEKHSGGVAEYRASEGKRVLIPFRGSVVGTLKEILGGVRSTLTYVGASKLKELSRRTTFIRVNRQLNNIFTGLEKE